jgi:hypothetical protein
MTAVTLNSSLDLGSEAPAFVMSDNGRKTNQRGIEVNAASHESGSGPWQLRDPSRMTWASGMLVGPDARLICSVC